MEEPPQCLENSGRNMIPFYSDITRFAAKHLVPVSPYFNDTIIFKDGNLNENFRKFYLWLCVSMLSYVQLFVNPMDRLLCSWDSPGKNTGVSCLFQSVFQTQEIKIMFPAVAGEFFSSCATWEALCLGAPSQNGTTMLRSIKKKQILIGITYISVSWLCSLLIYPWKKSHC